MNRVLLALVLLLLIAFGARAQTTNGLSEAEIQGRQLVSEILSEKPVTNLTQTGVLQIRNSEGTTSIPITFTTDVGQGAWRVIYEATIPGNPARWESLMIVRQDGQPNEYDYSSANAGSTIRGPMQKLSQAQIMAPFANSDFWISDLGLEFFHWPDQKVLKHEDRRTRACAVLESTNPNPSPGAYSRVDSWIDNETLGIVHAEAYGADGKLLKVFDPKSFKKVNDQWELQDMEIHNVQTHSRTWIKFNLNK